MRTISLGQTNLYVSRLSFGTAWMGSRGDDMTAKAGADLLLQARRQGITFWDTADDYGTHPHVALALKQIPREQVVVASKKTTAKGSEEIEQNISWLEEIKFRATTPGGGT